MNRHLWLNNVNTNYCPPWPCPICRQGYAVLRAKSFSFSETIDSKQAHGEDCWGPENIEFAFTAWADCSNESCAQEFAIAGKGGVDQILDETDGSTDWIEIFQPRLIFPAPRIFAVPPACPRSVRFEIDAVFQLYWADIEACANRLRVALEALLTHLGVAVTEGADPEKARRLSLHRRIELFSADNPLIGQHVMALKWLGNSGSHGRGVSRGELLDAFEIFENVLTETLERRTARLDALANKLTSRHGAGAT